MKHQLIASTTFAGIALLGSLWGVSQTYAQSVKTQEVTIQFRAMVGDQAFSCSESYKDLGKPPTPVTATDFRFYISDIALIDARGKVIPLKLTQDGKWQYQNVALLDFENKSGGCTNGTVEVRDRVVGTLPKGKYKGLQFTLGVPFDLNHEDATVAPSPLNLTPLWWSWRLGYKFVRIDLINPSGAENRTAQQEGQIGDKGFAIHIGSTGCQVEDNSQKPTSCANPNTSTITLAKFNPDQNVVIADLKALLADTNLGTNQPLTAFGCMSEPEDKDCTGIMANFGIPFGDELLPKQTFFRVESYNQER